MLNNMVRIDLTNLDKSEVKYEMSVFPDGEPHIKLDEFDRKKDYNVICRISNPNDLFLVMQVGDVLRRADVEWELTILYLMSMRMDRVVNFRESFTLKLVAEVINNLAPKKVHILEPHSSRTLSLINNSDAMPSYFTCSSDVTYCYPDHGAAERYHAGENDIVLCKKRDLENKGQIISIEVESEPKVVKDTIMIEDDLCDAGGTFAWSAKILREKYPNAKLAIRVVHLVNPVGLEKLAANFDDVYISNSYKDWDISKYPNVHMYGLK